MSTDATPTVQLRVLEDAYEHALTVLRDPGGIHLDAVVWVSAHLGAAQHALYPVVARTLGASSAVALHRSGRQIESALRTLERTLSGDSSAAHVDRARHVDALVELVAARAESEHLLLNRLESTLSSVEQARLADSYLRTLERAPTRPHPHAPHRGRLGAVAFYLNVRRDHVMDVVDARRVPTPHPIAQPGKSGRWGDYLLGHGTDRTGSS
jgi:hypothetical protein